YQGRFYRGQVNEAGIAPSEDGSAAVVQYDFEELTDQNPIELSQISKHFALVVRWVTCNCIVLRASSIPNYYFKGRCNVFNRL
ncbi:MAG TPA: hypothetical protein VGE97_06275, partial [Nitrososphaera sp.]